MQKVYCIHLQDGPKQSIVVTTANDVRYVFEQFQCKRSMNE